MPIQPDFTLTPAAEKFIRRMVRFSEHPAGGFRLSVSPGGCSGYSSEFTVEAAPRGGDAEVLAAPSLRMFLPAESRLLLQGVSIDFADTPTKSGLVITDPKAAACACSSSGDAAPATAPAEAAVALSSLRRMVKS
ncbi:MAG: iron-sulfur cluster assembly accessory protein [Rubrivivax sp.]|nr:iron-sulfur cluster assembly accessory protein [Rubrivivax sp.]